MCDQDKVWVGAKERGEHHLDFFQKPESLEGSLPSGLRDGLCSRSAWV